MIFPDEAFVAYFKCIKNKNLIHKMYHRYYKIYEAIHNKEPETVSELNKFVISFSLYLGRKPIEDIMFVFDDKEFNEMLIKFSLDMINK